jgi:hypothetical protein
MSVEILIIGYVLIAIVSDIFFKFRSTVYGTFYHNLLGLAWIVSLPVYLIVELIRSIQKFNKPTHFD